MRHDSRRLLPYFLIILSKMPPVVSDVVVAAAVEDCSGYFSANVEFVHVNMSDEGYRSCPLCAEEMLLTEQQLKHCDICYEELTFTCVATPTIIDTRNGWLLMPGLPDDRCGSAGVKLLMTLADIN
ncbi:hypothetical protein Tco_0386551 [Tanacetum coccineum]